MKLEDIRKKVEEEEGKYGSMLNSVEFPTETLGRITVLTTAGKRRLSNHNKLTRALATIADHAETCGLFIFNESGCTCHIEKIAKIMGEE